MKLWLISQDVNNNRDTYDSAVVACETEEEARHTHPCKHYKWDKDVWGRRYGDGHPIFLDADPGSWCHPRDVEVKLIGEACDGIVGLVCDSFNAG